MLIGIDARFAVHNRRGIGNYTLQLVQNLADLDSLNEYILYIDRNDLEDVLPKQKNFKIKKLHPSNYLLWEQVILPIQAKKDRVDILHCTGNTAPVLLSRQNKLVSSLMDVMYFKDYSVLPESTSMYQRLGRIYRKTIVSSAMKHVSRIITISNFTKVDIIKHLPNLSEDIFFVTYLAPHERFRFIDRSDAATIVRDRVGIVGRYLLTLGATDPRKNTELVINKFIDIKSERKIKEKLVIVGIPNWRQTKFYDIANKSMWKNDIIFTDFVSDDDLVLLYNCATIFLYPSLYEGFGIPTLEAMACGVPVIASNTTSIPEIVGDAALLIDPNDGKEFKAALLRLLNDEDLRNELIKRGYERAKVFSWKEMAKETLAVYESILREGLSE